MMFKRSLLTSLMLGMLLIMGQVIAHEHGSAGIELDHHCVACQVLHTPVIEGCATLFVAIDTAETVPLSVAPVLHRQPQRRLFNPRAPPLR